MPALNSEAPPSEAASSEAPPLPKAPPVSPMPTWARSAPGPATTKGSAEAWPFSEAPPPEASPTEAALSEAPPPPKAPPTYHLIGAFLQPASLIGVLALASRRIRQAAFDVWVEQAIQAANCSLVADEAMASKVTRSALVCLHGIMDSWHASMLYVAFAARATPNGDKLITARALRDIITRCVIREVGLCKESLFKAKMRLIFGEYLEHGTVNGQQPTTPKMRGSTTVRQGPYDLYFVHWDSRKPPCHVWRELPYWNELVGPQLIPTQ